MKKTLYILVVIFLVVSCSYPIRKGFNKSDKKIVTVFNNNFEKAIYKTNINIYKKHFTGIMVIKKITLNNNYRIVFLSELGMKIFDFEFNTYIEDEFKIHYILEPLNKKILIKTLKNDFKLLLMNFKTKNIETYKNKNLILNKIKYKGLYNYYIFNTDSNYITNITQKSWIFKRLNIINNGYSQNSPDSINFTHKGLKLKIRLKKIY